MVSLLKLYHFTEPWIIAKSDFEGEPKQLLLTVRIKEGVTKLPCPKCESEDKLSAAWPLLRQALTREYSKLGRALSLREFLRDLWNYADRDLAEEHFESWYSWARRCRLEPFKKLAKTLKEHWDGILACYENWTTTAVIEAINGKLQLARKQLP